MTEDDLRKRAGFHHLPVFDAADDRCESLLRCHDTNYDGTIQEAEDDGHFLKLIQDPKLEAKGAVRYSPTDVRVVFWTRRPQ